MYVLFSDFYDQFSFNQVFRPKTPCSCIYRADFDGFCVYHTYLSGGGGQMGQACTTEQVSVHGKSTAVYLAIVGLTDSERFLLEVKM